jgi:hypothetical protein
LGREEAWNSLKVLVRKGIIKKKRSGRIVFYEPAVNDKTLEYIIQILNEGGLRKFMKIGMALTKSASRFNRELISKAKELKPYEQEMIELGETPYVNTLPDAKNWRQTKKEESMPDSVSKPKRVRSLQTDSQREEARKLLVTPKNPETKEVTLPSGLKPTIRKLTSLEIIDLHERISHQEKTRVSDPDFVEALKRLLS